jgi:hypothetical protein
MRGLAVAVALAGALAQGCAARDAPVTCEHVQLALAAGLTPEIVARDWASGEPHGEANAVLELRGCAGQLLDRLELAAPLATLDPTRLRGAPLPTWLVSVDLTAPAGSTSGPLTLPIEVAAHHLRPASARDASGHEEPIRLAATGKSAWKKLPGGRLDDLLAIASAPEDGGFVTTWRRYHPGARGWTLRTRRQPGLWESDADFPPAAAFP